MADALGEMLAEEVLVSDELDDCEPVRLAVDVDDTDGVADKDGLCERDIVALADVDGLAVSDAVVLALHDWLGLRVNVELGVEVALDVTEELGDSDGDSLDVVDWLGVCVALGRFEGDLD